MDVKIGDFVKGKANNKYGITNEKMTKAVVTEILSSSRIKIKILEHESSNDTGSYDVDTDQFEVIGHQKKFDREEVFELLKNGCKKAILDYDLTGANLTEADLRRANLRRADLTEADLRRADLTEADLTGANLRRADLTGADLRRANLTGANLTEADLRRANLTGADLTGADLDFSCVPLWCGSLKMKVDKRVACQLAYHLCSMQCGDEEYLKMRNSILEFANKFHRVGECGELKKIESEE